MPRKDIVAPKGKAKYEEIVKCGADPLYFLKRYGYISHPKKGLIKFDTFPFQDDCVKDFEAHRFNIVLKSRQLGLSTVCAGYCLWMALFQKSKNIMVLATRLEVAKTFLRKVLVMYDNLPEWLVLPREKSRSVKSIEFTNESRITAVPTGDDAGRSEGLSLLIVDEAAHIQGFDELWMGLYSTVSTGGNIILLSCVTKDTFVFTEKGPKEVSAFIPPGNLPGDYILDSPYAIQGNQKIRSGNLWHNQGVVKTKKIKTALGSLQGSYLHKVWATTQDGSRGWKEFRELQPGDWIAHHGGQELWGSNDTLKQQPISSLKRRNKLTQTDKITPDLAYFLGLFIAEGNVRKDGNGKKVGVTITCGDDISGVITSLGLSFSKTDSVHYNIGSDHLVRVMSSLGFELDRKASHKIIPSRLMEMSRDNIVALLQGIFDGDGTIHKTTGSVSLTSTSLRLIEQVRVLLSNFGIWSNYEEIPKNKLNSYKSVRNEHNHANHKLDINGKDALAFCKKIGFRLSRKQERVARLEKANLHRASSHDLVPFSFELAKRIILEVGLTQKEIASLGLLNVHGHRKYKSSHLSRQTMMRLLEYAEPRLSELTKEELSGVVSSHLRWSRIKEIQESEAEVYDFSLPENPQDPTWCHSIVYNGILGHQTPKGVGNVFHKTWMGCDLEKGENDFHGIKLPWTVHPEHGQDWFEEQCRNLDPRGIQQELLCSFLGSGHTYLHEGALEYLNSNVQPPIERLGDDGGIWVWKYPETGHNYIISADVARGDSEDYSTAHVIDTTSDEVVAEYQGKIPPDRYAELLADLGERYFKALICPENNTFGLATAYKLRDMKYPNLYYEKFAKSGIYQHYTPEEVKDLMPGISTTVKNRQQILAKLEEVIRNKKIRVYSSRFAEEAKTFIWNSNVSGGKAQAMKGYNDDLIMSLAIGCYLYDAEDQKVDNDELNKAMLSAWGKSVTKLTNNTYSAPQPESAGPMAFQRVNYGSAYVYQQGEKPYFDKDPSQQNMKPGVSLEQARKTISTYNAYSWLFSDDDRPKRK